MGISDGLCVLCRTKEESVKHLFFDCQFAGQCISGIKRWLNIQMQTNDLEKQIRWLQRVKASAFQKQVMTAAIASTVYNVWRQRNNTLWNEEQFAVEQVIGKVRRDVLYRVYTNNCFKNCKEGMVWLLGCN